MAETEEYYLDVRDALDVERRYEETGQEEFGRLAFRILHPQIGPEFRARAFSDLMVHKGLSVVDAVAELEVMGAGWQATIAASLLEQYADTRDLRA